VSDIDSLLCNFWRSVQMFPNETAEAASWPVSELDKHARGCYLLRWREEEGTARLAGDPHFCDPTLAGWWAWCVCCSIGAWGMGGPWWPDADGVLRKRPRGHSKGENGVRGNLPPLGNNGQGVNRPQAREPGVWANLPHLTGNGKGVNHAGTREPGVSADRPHMGDNGKGVNRPQAREPGVSADLPHLVGDGMGVNRPQAREPGLTWQQHVAMDYTETEGYHPRTMPEIRRWFDYLSARLRHVRIINGDWMGAVNGSYKRVLTTGAAHTLPVRSGKGQCGVFLDPPYGDVGRGELYGAHESFSVAEEVRQWCLTVGDDPKWRIVYAGFDQEGTELVEAGWREIEWFRGGHLKGGMGNTSKTTKKHQQHRERLWLSPHCVTAEPETDKTPDGYLF